MNQWIHENKLKLLLKNYTWQVKHQGPAIVSLLGKNSSESGSILYSCLWAYSAAKWVAMATFLQHLAHSNDSKRSHTLASPALLSPSNVSILQRKPCHAGNGKFVKDHFCVSVMPCCRVLHNNTSMILFIHQLKIGKEIDHLWSTT